MGLQAIFKITKKNKNIVTVININPSEKNFFQNLKMLLKI